jgi:hypothetical protein
LVGSALLQLERNGALFGVHGLLRSKSLDTADIVREAMLQQQFTVPLREELNGSRFEVVHRASNFYAAHGFKVAKHRALFPNVGDSQ